MIPKDNEISTLAKLGEDLYTAEEEVLLLEAQLKRAKRRRDVIQCEEIPEAMAEMGIAEIRLTNGDKIELKPILRVSPLKENRPLVFQTVEEAGDGALIKSTVLVAFGRGEEEAVKKFLADLQTRGLQAKQEIKIEAATLKKWVRTRLEQGEAVDMNLFGVHQFKMAVFGDGGPEAPVFDDE